MWTAPYIWQHYPYQWNVNQRRDEICVKNVKICGVSLCIMRCITNHDVPCCIIDSMRKWNQVTFRMVGLNQLKWKRHFPPLHYEYQWNVNFLFLFLPPLIIHLKIRVLIIYLWIGNGWESNANHDRHRYVIGMYKMYG